MITPEEFAKRMQELKDRNPDYEEDAHKEMDALMCMVLKELGYREGVKIWLSTSKWFE